MKRAFSYIGFSSFLLFFSVMFIPFFYMSTGKEYDYNQQVSRGFISRSAAFFYIDTGETEPDFQVHIEYNTGEVFDFGTYSQSELDEHLSSPEELEDYIASITPPPEAVLTYPNTRDASGLSVVERLLTAGTGDYLAAVHDGDTRYVFYSGEPKLPPVVSGRFFTPSECLSSEKLAVIGSNYMDDTYEVGEERFILYNDVEYKVIGVAGLSYPTTLDSLRFFNLGSAPFTELNGIRFFVDGKANSPEKNFETMKAFAQKEIGTELIRMDMPTTLTDLVSGGVYLKQHLTVLTFVFIVLTYLSILTYTLSAENKKIGVMLLSGISVNRIFRHVYGRIFAFGIAGIVLGAIVSSATLSLRYFQLSVSLVFRDLVFWCAISLFLLLLCIIPIVFRVRTLHVEEVIRKS